MVFSTSVQATFAAPKFQVTDTRRAVVPAVAAPATHLAFRSALDPHTQKLLINDHHALRHDLWVLRQEEAKNSTIKIATKRNQALHLAYLVAEAHRFQCVMRNKRHAPTVALLRRRGIVPVLPRRGAKLDISQKEVASMVFHDVFALIEDPRVAVGQRYECVRTQLISLSLWQ